MINSLQSSVSEPHRRIEDCGPLLAMVLGLLVAMTGPASIIVGTLSSGVQQVQQSRPCDTPFDMKTSDFDGFLVREKSAKVIATVVKFILGSTRQRSRSAGSYRMGQFGKWEPGSVSVAHHFRLMIAWDRRKDPAQPRNTRNIA